MKDETKNVTINTESTVIFLTKAVFSYDLLAMSGEPGPDIVRSYPFTRVAYNERA